MTTFVAMATTITIHVHNRGLTLCPFGISSVALWSEKQTRLLPPCIPHSLCKHIALQQTGRKCWGALPWSQIGDTRHSSPITSPSTCWDKPNLQGRVRLDAIFTRERCRIQGSQRQSHCRDKSTVPLCSSLVRPAVINFLTTHRKPNHSISTTLWWQLYS